MSIWTAKGYRNVSLRTTPAYGHNPTAHFDSSRETPKPKVEEPKVLSLGWETIHHAVDALCCQVGSNKPDYIIGISRGGLIPATLMSHKLDVPLRVVRAESYDSTNTRVLKDKPTEIVGWFEEYNRKNVLIVDDILDTGKTIEAIKDQDPGRHMWCMAVVNKRPHSHPLTAHFITVDPSIWVKFPWEV